MALNERSKALYQPWNQEGFNADLYVRKMTNTQRWIYKTLLQEAFVCSTRPRLPDDDEQLWMIADCEDIDQWLKNKTAVLRMFERIQEDGVPLLLHRRLEEDWNRLLEKREGKVEAGRKGAERRWGKTMANDSTAIATDGTPIANDAKGSEVREVSEAKEESNEPSDASFKNDRQGELMKLKAELTRIAAEYGAKAGGYKTTWESIKTLGIAHGTYAVANDFQKWMEDNQGDDFPFGAVAQYLYTASERLQVDSPITRASKTPETVNLTRELAFLSGGQLAFGDKHRVRLAEVLEEFSSDEIIAAFKTWLESNDLSDPYTAKGAANSFSQTADQLCYSARKRKAEMEAAKEQRDAMARRLELEAEEERARKAEAKANQEEIFDPLA